MDFVSDYKYQSTSLNIATCFSRVSHKSPRFHLGHVNAVDSVLTGQYIRIDNGAIQRAFYISFILSLLPISLFIHTFISRQTGECIGSFLRDPVGVYCSIPFDQCFDGFYFLCDSTWLLCPLKNVKWADWSNQL